MFWWMFGVGRGCGDIGFLALLGMTVALSGHVREMEMLMPSPSAPLDTGLRRYDGLVALVSIFIAIVHVGSHRHHRR